MSVLDKPRDMHRFEMLPSTTLIAHLDPDDLESSLHFDAISESLHESFIFGKVFGSALGDEGVQVPSIVLHMPFDEERHVFQQDHFDDKSAILVFVERSIESSIVELDPILYETYYDVSYALAESEI
jgi:hypothetical protein